MSEHGTSAASKSVLLVDSESDFRQRFRPAFEMHGYRVIHAGRGTPALAAVDANDPNAVITTFTFRAEHDLTLAHHIRARPFGAFSTIVGLSADAVTPARRTQGEEAGYDLLVSTPVLPWSLAARVDQVVRASRELRALSREALGAERRIPETPRGTSAAPSVKTMVSRAAVLMAANRIVRDFLPSATGTNIISVDTLADAMHVRREVCMGALDELAGLGFFERVVDGSYKRVPESKSRRRTDRS